MKNYVLDTNVPLHDPNSLFSFKENRVIIPIVVIKEIDAHKRDGGELGRNAREVSRMIDALRRNGQISEGVRLSNGGILQVLVPSNNGNRRNKRRHNNGNGDNDDLIIAAALHIKGLYPTIPTILVTKDTNVRIFADTQKLQVEDYEMDHVRDEDVGMKAFEMTVEADTFQAFTKTGGFDLETPRQVNTYGKLLCPQQGKGAPKFTTVLVKVDESGTRIVPIHDSQGGANGVKPRNIEQHFAFDALLNDEIKLVTLMGKAGTGKTLLAMAAGLKRVTETKAFRRLVVARPPIPMGKEVGFLPGTLEEKLNPWMQPIHDALELLVDLNMGSGRRSTDLTRSGEVVVEALCHIRGRSITNQFMVIDEAQNLTPLEVKTIVTRVGPGTKIVFTGDPWQIDNPYVDYFSNGLVYLVKRFANQPIAAHIFLEKGERSELAELAANLL